ncbi:MAG: hypothetical protein AAGH15_27590 [Myxococcota bacterium]
MEDRPRKTSALHRWSEGSGIRPTLAAADVVVTWREQVVPGRGLRLVGSVVRAGEALGELRLLQVDRDVDALAMPFGRAFGPGVYVRDFYEWFYETWFLELREPPLILESVRFVVDTDPTLDVEARATLEGIDKLARPGAAVLGPTLGSLAPEVRHGAKAGGLVAWASRVRAELWEDALVVAATNDFLGPFGYGRVD